MGLGTNIFSLRYEYSISIELKKNGAHHLKEHPIISKFAKFDGYCFKSKGTVHLVWIGGTGVSIHTKLSYFSEDLSLIEELPSNRAVFYQSVIQSFLSSPSQSWASIFIWTSFKYSNPLFSFFFCFLYVPSITVAFGEFNLTNLS